MTIDFSWVSAKYLGAQATPHAVRGQVVIGGVVERTSGAVLAVIEQHRHPYASRGGCCQRPLHPLVGQLIHRYIDALPGAVDQRDEWRIAGAGLGDQRQPAGGTVPLAGVCTAYGCGGGTGCGATADGEQDGSTPAAKQTTAHQAQADGGDQRTGRSEGNVIVAGSGAGGCLRGLEVGVGRQIAAVGRGGLVA